MNRRTMIFSAMALPLVAAGCGKMRDSRLNPFNWFGRSRRNETKTTLAPNEAADGRQLIAEVTHLEVVKNPTGAIVQAAGLPPTQGWWKAELVADNYGEPVDGVLTYRFLVFQPAGAADVSTPQSRELTAAKFISNTRLAAITKIVVQGEKNSMSSGR